ncbi:MAG: tyrosine-type recombinase/integrase [Roseburia sp.]
MSQQYKEQTKYLDTIKTKELLSQLPSFCTDYYIARKIRLTPKTQYDYVCKMKIFLEYLQQNHPIFLHREMTSYTYQDLSILTAEDIRKFVAWILEQPAKPNSSRLNSTSTAENYLACLSSYWKFFCKNEYLDRNPFLAIDREKRRKKEIIYLQQDQKDDFKAAVTYGEGLSEKQRAFHEKNMLRELCICQILLDTGIRVSELVGLNVSDIDFKHCCLFIQRKGDKEDTVYFSDETKEILKDYLETRPIYQPADEEDALFLVSIGTYKGQRLSVRSVQKLVKKYALAAHLPQGRQITPHKLRSTYAMDMLRKTGNFSLVSEQLGHESILTTQVYAKAEESTKEQNRNQLQE